jgi:hypothetical protein
MLRVLPERNLDRTPASALAIRTWFRYCCSLGTVILKTAVESLRKRHAAGLGTTESLCLVTRARLQSGRKRLKITVGFSPCGKAGGMKNACLDSLRASLFDCSATRQNGEIIYRCNHLRFEEYAS